MDTLSYKTISVNKEKAEHNWYIIDAEDKSLGRLASNISMVLRGKNKPSYTPHADTGDRVIVINAGKLAFTEKKLNQKKYIRHSGYPGGQKESSLKVMLEKNPTEVLFKAVRGMLPNNKLRKVCLKNLYLYLGKEHPHTAQKPKEIHFKY